MLPRRRVPTRAHPASSDKPEQTQFGPDKQSEVQELRTQVVGLSEAYRRQGKTLDRMMQLLEQRALQRTLPAETSPVAASLVAVFPVAPVVPVAHSVPMTSGSGAEVGWTVVRG